MILDVIGTAFEVAESFDTIDHQESADQVPERGHEVDVRQEVWAEGLTWHRNRSLLETLVSFRESDRRRRVIRRRGTVFVWNARWLVHS